ncbi:MAG: septum formation protein Maf, partial [Chloroflexi bacterium]|nr:septum formation protein Maf [Chloroflexota bacterium]
ALASEKAEDVARRHPGATVLGADTVVVVDGAVLGKPEDPEDALRMLSLLRGRRHLVVTGVALYCGGWLTGSAAAEVIMRDFDDGEARRYVATGEPMDKAGAYAVQGEGGRLVERVSGCYSAVVGLPLCLTGDFLRHCGLLVSVPVGARCDHRC